MVMGWGHLSRAGLLVRLWQVLGPALRPWGAQGSSASLISPARLLLQASLSASPGAPYKYTVCHHLRRVRSAGQESDWFGRRGVCSLTHGGWKKEKFTCLWIFPSDAVTLNPGFTLKPIGIFLPIFYENFKYTAKLKEFYSEQ